MRNSPVRITWGLMLVWLGVMLVMDERPGVASIGAGVILVLHALLRRALTRRAGAFIPLVGVLLVLMGLNDLNGKDRGIPFLATALIALGALVLVRAFAGPRFTSQRGIQVTFGDPRPRNH